MWEVPAGACQVGNLTAHLENLFILQTRCYSEIDQCCITLRYVFGVQFGSRVTSLLALPLFTLDNLMVFVFLVRMENSVLGNALEGVPEESEEEEQPNNSNVESASNLDG